MVAPGTTVNNLGVIVSTTIAVVLIGVVCYYAGTRRSLFLGAGALSTRAFVVAALLVHMSRRLQDDRYSSTTPSSELASFDKSSKSCNLVFEYMPPRHCKRSHIVSKPPRYDEAIEYSYLDNLLI